MIRLTFILIFIPNILFAGSMKSVGVKGKATDISRVIKVFMYDNYYQPNKEIKNRHS